MDKVSVTDIRPRATIVKVTQWETDSEKAKPLATADVPASYCWLIIVGSEKAWLSQDESPLEYLTPSDPEEDSPVVGRLVGVNLPDGSLSYGSPDDPRHRCDVTEAALDRMIAAGLVPAAMKGKG